MHSEFVTTEEQAPLEDEMSLYKDKDENLDVHHC